MRVGPVEIEDYTKDHWRVCLIIDGARYFEYWYTKNFKGCRDERNILKQYTKDLKAEVRRSGMFFSIGSYSNTFNIMDFVKEIEYSIPFMEACYDETNDG